MEHSTSERKPLTSVHEALNNATFAERPAPGEVVAFRLDADLKAEVIGICERHATTVSEFLRQCCAGLVNDYRDPSRG
jgi:hypothetical protein